MIDLDELAICKRRGHDPASGLMPGKWAQCKWCWMWVRKVETFEEREDDPPENERDLFNKVK